jgi:hypothetical protein
LLPEVARQPGETRELFAEQLWGLLAEFAETLVGALQLARAAPSKAQSDHILSAEAEAARALAQAARDGASGNGLEPDRLANSSR